MKSKEERFLELISCIDINNPVMDFDRYGNKLFWFDYEGKYIFHYNLENQWFWFKYDEIWSVSEKEYSLNYNENQSFIKTMVEQHFKLKDVIPWAVRVSPMNKVEQHFKFKGVIPC